MSEPVWRERAGFRDLRSVIDPADANGRKNTYIDMVQKLALQRSFRIGPDDVVLDFGCGVGRFTEWLEKRSGHVIGIDAVPEMVEVARELHPKSQCKWLTYSGSRLPLDDSSVDRILSVWVLQHMLDDLVLGQLVDEFARILRPRGTVALIEQVVPGSGKLVSGYIHQRTVAEYEHVFKTSGFAVSSSRPIRAPWRIASAAVRRPVPAAGLWVLAGVTLMLARSLSANSPYMDQLMILTRSAER